MTFSLRLLLALVQVLVFFKPTLSLQYDYVSVYLGPWETDVRFRVGCLETQCIVGIAPKGCSGCDDTCGSWTLIGTLNKGDWAQSGGAAREYGDLLCSTGQISAMSQGKNNNGQYSGVGYELARDGSDTGEKFGYTSIRGSPRQPGTSQTDEKNKCVIASFDSWTEITFKHSKYATQKWVLSPYDSVEFLNVDPELNALSFSSSCGRIAVSCWRSFPSIGDYTVLQPLQPSIDTLYGWYSRNWIGVMMDCNTLEPVTFTAPSCVNNASTSMDLSISANVYRLLNGEQAYAGYGIRCERQASECMAAYSTADSSGYETTTQMPYERFSTYFVINSPSKDIAVLSKVKTSCYKDNNSTVWKTTSAFLNTSQVWTFFSSEDMPPGSIVECDDPVMIVLQSQNKQEYNVHGLELNWQAPAPVACPVLTNTPTASPAVTDPPTKFPTSSPTVPTPLQTVAPTTTEEKNNQLILRVTYRDFLPASCYFIGGSNSVNNTDLFVQAWGSSAASGLQDNFRCENYWGSKWKSFVDQGLIRGHPDFQVEGTASQFLKCDTEFDPNFPAGACVNENPDYDIIKRNLTYPDDSGLSKPEYCDDSNGDNTRCGRSTSDNNYMQSNKKYFDMWYTDNKVYNKRVGQLLRLQRDNADTNIYRFNSLESKYNEHYPFSGNIDNTFFGPLGRFKKVGGYYEVLEADYSDPYKAPAWPQIPGNDLNYQYDRAFWITTEVHTFFEYRVDGDMIFTFSGDDDFWAFVNDQMVISLPGVHASEKRNIDLNAQIPGSSETIAQRLGLVDRNIYTLDFFHAERQAPKSNFLVETSLVTACSILQVGTSEFDLRQSIPSSTFDDDYAKTATVKYDENENTIQISNENDVSKSSYIYTKQKKNVARGFITTFHVSISNLTDGFAFVIQGQGLENYISSGTPHFNFKYLKNSVAIVFDICASSLKPCGETEIRVHYPGQPTEANSIYDDTKRVNTKQASIFAEEGAEFDIEIAYYGGRPDFLEVYIDNSLYLREKGFNILSILEAEGGHVGFTSTTSDVASNISISDWRLSTVSVFPPNAELISQVYTPSTNDTNVTQNVTQNTTDSVFEYSEQYIIADGITYSQGYTVQSKDSCDTPLSYGSLSNLVHAIYVHIPAEDLINETRATEVIPAYIVDNDNGTYTASMRTEIIGNFSLYLSFGEQEDCELLYNASEDNFSVQVNNNESCYFVEVENAVITLPIPPEPVDDDGDFAADDNEAFIMTVTVSSSIVGFLLIVALSMFFLYRRRWARDKKFIAEGQEYILETNTQMSGADEYSLITARVVNTNAAIIRKEAETNVNPEEKERRRLRLENEELREQAKLKERKLKQDAINRRNSPKESKKNPKFKKRNEF